MIRKVGGPSGPQPFNFQGQKTANRVVAITLPAIASFQRSASAMGKSLNGRVKATPGKSPLATRMAAAFRRSF